MRIAGELKPSDRNGSRIPGGSSHREIKLRRRDHDETCQSVPISGSGIVLGLQPELGSVRGFTHLQCHR